MHGDDDSLFVGRKEHLRRISKYTPMEFKVMAALTGPGEPKVVRAHSRGIRWTPQERARERPPACGQAIRESRSAHEEDENQKSGGIGGGADPDHVGQGGAI